VRIHNAEELFLSFTLDNKRREQRRRGSLDPRVSYEEAVHKTRIIGVRKPRAYVHRSNVYICVRLSLCVRQNRRNHEFDNTRTAQLLLRNSFILPARERLDGIGSRFESRRSHLRKKAG
jgi:hypothetical protein